MDKLGFIVVLSFREMYSTSTVSPEAGFDIEIICFPGYKLIDKYTIPFSSVVLVYVTLPILMETFVFAKTLLFFQNFIVCLETYP